MRYGIFGSGLNYTASGAKITYRDTATETLTVMAEYRNKGWLVTVRDSTGKAMSDAELITISRRR